MRTVLSVVFLLLPFLSAAGTTSGTADSAHLFYDKKQYEKAAALYEKIVAANPDDAAACYNLGNAYFQLKKNGQSILWFEKALKKAPGDADIRYNLELARARVSGGEKNNDVSETLGNVWYDFLLMQGEKFWGYTTIITLVLAALCLGGFIVSRKKIWKRANLVIAVLMGCSGIFTFIAGWQLQQYNAQQYAIITEPETVLYTAPADKAKTQITLNEGTKVLAGPEKGNWIQVTVSREISGWVKRSDLTEI